MKFWRWEEIFQDNLLKKKSYVLVIWWGCPRDVMVKAMDSGIVLQSRYYVHFRANTLGKGMKPPYPPNYGLTSITTDLQGEWLGHWITYKGWYAIKERKIIFMMRDDTALTNVYF